MNGSPLPPQHGYPLRLVVPGWYGMTNVKWLAEIEVLTEPFTGYQNAQGYRLRQEEDEEGEPLARMLPRSLIVPPGIPEFLSRDRTVQAGDVLEGRAWSGHAVVESVDVSVDGGATWARPSWSRPAASAGPGAASASAGSPSPGTTSSAHAHGTRRETSSRSSRSGTSAATRTTRCSASR